MRLSPMNSGGSGVAWSPLKVKLPPRLSEVVQTHLLLGRVSNLPTVWSNCLAAGALASIALMPTLFIMMASMSLLYVCGMYLNDACDAEIDARNMANRPIPLYRISRTTVYSIAFVMLATGLAVTWGEGWGTFGCASILVCIIIVYNLIHT